MGHNTFISKIGYQLIGIFHLQLFLTLVSWPILIFWGLPLSIMSPVGNFIFSPVIILFLLLSSLIFFCELFYLPNKIFVIMLDYLTQGWLMVIHASSSRWLLGMPVAFKWLLVLLPFIALYILRYRPWQNIHKNAAGLFLVFCLCAGVLAWGKNKKEILEIPGARNQKLTCYCDGKKALVLASTGLQPKALDDWIEYTLYPELLKAYGSLYIDYLILLSPKKNAFMLAQILIEKGLVGTLCIKRWDEWLEGPVYWSYKRAQETAKKQDVPLRYFKDTFSIGLHREVLKIDGASIGFLSDEKKAARN